MNIEIANRLVNLRKEKGFSQEQLAEKIGVSRQAVSKWERSEASPDTDNLIMLARLYEVSLDELLRTEDEIPQPEETEQYEEQPPQAEPEENEDLPEPPTEEQPPQAEPEENEDLPEPPTEEQPQETSAENAEEVPTEQTNSIGETIAKRASKMTDILWLKLLIVVAAIPIAFFTSLRYGNFEPKWFLIVVFAVVMSFSIIDAVHSRDIRKFKIWTLSMIGVSLHLDSYYAADNLAAWLMLTPLYELVLWTVRRIRKK